MEVHRWKWVALVLLCLCFLLVWLLSWGENLVSRSPVRWVVTVFLPLFMAAHGLRRKSLDFSGAMMAILVGFILTAASACFCVSMLTFFLSSSRLTKWKGKEKEKYEDDYKEGGQRNWIQVICNGGIASVAALLYLSVAGMGERPILLATRPTMDWATLYALSCLAALSCSCGDTWASEVGSVLGGTPRLITTWRLVPRGTNGGVTVVGIFCSLAGGLVVGMAYFLTLVVFLGTENSQLSVIGVGAVSGLAGSVVDSVLGATVQYTGFSSKLGKVVYKPLPGSDHVSGVDILDNHAVNLVSSLITAIVVPATCMLLF